MDMNNLTVFREDLESFLRRVDHSGDQQISLDEFIEATSCNEDNVNYEEAEFIGHHKSESKRELALHVN